MPRQQEHTTYDAKLKPTVPFDMDTLSQGGPDLEIVGQDADFRALAEDAAFMEEKVDIRFQSSGDPNAPRMIEVGVGTSAPDGKTGRKSTRMAFHRNQIYSVPRFIVEALAHAKISTLRQVQDPRNPMEMLNVVEHQFFYPFSVIRDENAKGAMWLERVLADPC